MTCADRHEVHRSQSTASDDGRAASRLTIEGAGAAPLAGVAEFGMEDQVRKGLTLSTGYRGVFSDRLHDSQIGARLRVHGSVEPTVVLCSRQGAVDRGSRRPQPHPRWPHGILCLRSIGEVQLLWSVHLIASAADLTADLDGLDFDQQSVANAN